MHALNLNNVGQWEEDKFQFVNVFISCLKDYFFFKITFIGVMSFNKCTLASVGFPIVIWCKLKTQTGSNEKF